MRFARLLQGVLLAVAGGLQAQAPGALAEPQVAVRLEVDLQASTKVPFHGRVKLTRESSAGPEAKTELAFDVDSQREVKIALPADSIWAAEVTAPGFWVRRFVFQAGASGNQVQTLEAWPLGRVVGRIVSAEKPAALPKKLVVTTLPPRSSAKGRAAPKGEIECPVDPEGRFHCEVPAATYDLSVYVETFIPLYAWNVVVSGTGETDLKTLALRRGASLAGWVEPGAGGVIDPEKCRVILSPTVASGGGDLEALEKLSLMGREARVNERGFFQAVGLAPGSYTVGVEQEGALADPRGPIRVAAGGETYLSEPFLLEAPFDLTFVVEPGLDWRGRPWAVQVERSLGRGDFRTETVFEANASEEGVVRVANQKRGRFTVRVSDSTGQKMLTAHDLPILSPADARHTFEIRWIEIDGKIRLGQEPLRGALWFGGRNGVVSIRFDSDEEGRFSGVLPRDGHWLIELNADEPRISVELHRTIESRKGRAEIEIEVPATSLSGRVVNAEGQPENQAMVSVLESDGASQWLFTDASGRFEFRGVAPGSLTLGARSRRGDLAAAEQTIALPPDGEIGPVELTLRATARFSGVVRSARGVESGAAVAVMGFRPARQGIDRTRTAVDGGFEVKLPTGVERAVAVVGALGSALAAFEIRPGETSDLFVSAAGGTVEIDLGPSLRRRIEDQEAWLMLFQNGLEIPAQALGDWARSHGEPYFASTTPRFSNLAPGQYHACMVPLSARQPMARIGWSPNLAVECRSGSLPPGGTLRLDLGKSNENGDSKPAREN